MRKFHQIAPGVYAVVGSRDADGRAYRIHKVVDAHHFPAVTVAWEVRDSRNRYVSTHRTRADAYGSIDHGQE